MFQCASFRSYRLSLDIISQEKEEEEEEEGGVAEKSIAGGLVESMANNKRLYFLFLFFLVFVLVFSTANSYIVAGIVYLTSSAKREATHTSKCSLFSSIVYVCLLCFLVL